MASELGKGYNCKQVKIDYPNGDTYVGMGAAYYSQQYEPHGVGVFFQKGSKVSFEADWELREGPNFNSIRIVDKPKEKSFVIVQVKASEIYSDLVHLDIIEAKVGTYHFKELPSIILEPHAWSKHAFTIKNITDDELVFDFTGPKVDHGKFVDKVVKKGEPLMLTHTIPTTIIWDHGDEYDATITASIKVLYF